MGSPRSPRSRGAAALALAFAGAVACKSSAPYTLPAAAINTALAGGASLAQRASGGCYAECTNGTVCNPNTGLCERACAATCSSFEVCALDAYGVPHCVAPATQALSEEGKPSLPLPPGLEVAPAPGTVPSLPEPRPSPESR